MKARVVPLTLPLTSVHSRRKHLVVALQTNFLNPKINPRSQSERNLWKMSGAR